MPCTEKNAGKDLNTGVPDYGGLNWASGVSSNNRALVVSNWPETIELEWPDEADQEGEIPFPAQLYRCEIPLPQSGELEFRLFLWHVNATGSQKYFHIVLRMLEGTPAEVVEHRSEFGIQDPISATGICLAKVHLFGGTNWVNRPGGDIPTNGELGLPLGGYEVVEDGPQGNGFIGAIHEFKVRKTGQAPPEQNEKIELRTVISPSPTDFGLPSLQPLSWQPEKHIRGSWAYSDILVESAVGAIDVNAGPFPRTSFRIAQVPDGKDYVLFKKRGLSDPWGDDTWGTALGNRGLYGVNATYKIYVKNSGQDKHLDSYIRGASLEIPPDYLPRYLGAISRLVAPVNVGVPPLRRWMDGQNVEQAEKVPIASQTVFGSTSTVLEFPNAVAGSAGLPGEFYFEYAPVPFPIDG
ncbi:MAG: hypothetical protein IH851_10335 [Armatimonadetes bacterium]|nr:hypothetical protein [Armatimonadota bacterium]